MNLKIYIAIAVLETFSPLLPLIIYWRKKVLLENYMVYLGLLLLAAFTTEFMAMTSYFLGVHYMFKLIPQHIYYISSVIFTSLLYKDLFPMRFKYFFIVVIFVLTIPYLYNAFVSTTEITDHLSRLPRNIAFTLIPLVFFFILMNNMPGEGILRFPMFWINTSFLVFYAGTLLVSAFGNYLVQVLKDSMIGYGSFRNILAILSYGLIAIGLWQAEPKVKSL